MPSAYLSRLIAILALVGAACASTARPPRSPAGPVVEPADAAERQLLARLEGLASGSTVQLEGRTFVAGDVYAAASGRRCRTLELTANGGAQQTRLACHDGQAWFFAPDVLRAAPGGTP